jgi:structure-specific recognition protein 1
MTEARLKGINLLTELDMQGDKIVGKYQDGDIFSLPFNKINNTAIYNGNEIEIDIPFEEFNEQHDVFCGIRLFMPTKPDAAEAENEGKEAEPTLAESVHDQIRKKSNIEQNVGDLLCTLSDLPLVVPRGKYTADLYRDNAKSKGELKLHGSTFSYKINFKNIAKAFLLPQNDDVYLRL